MIAKITMFAAALSLGSALAAKQPQVNADTQIAVPYGDLDLTTAEGVKALDRRLRAAAAELCPVDPLPGDMRRGLTRKCVAEAIATAAPQVASAVAAGRNARYADRILAAR